MLYNMSIYTCSCSCDVLGNDTLLMDSPNALFILILHEVVDASNVIIAVGILIHC